MQSQRVINVLQESVVYWQVPKTPILGEVPAIPPVHVELPVSESENFCKNVESCVEGHVEKKYPTKTERSRKLDEEVDQVKNC